MLPGAGQVDKLEVEYTRMLVARELQDLLGSSLLHHTTLLKMRDWESPVGATVTPGDPKNVFYRGGRPESTAIRAGGRKSCG
jgi:hypothetical protein